MDDGKCGDLETWKRGDVETWECGNVGPEAHKIVWSPWMLDIPMGGYPAYVENLFRGDLSVIPLAQIFQPGFVAGRELCQHVKKVKRKNKGSRHK